MGVLAVEPDDAVSQEYRRTAGAVAVFLVPGTFFQHPANPALVRRRLAELQPLVRHQLLDIGGGVLARRGRSWAVFGGMIGAAAVIAVVRPAIFRSSSTGTTSSFSGQSRIADFRHGRDGWLLPFLVIVPYSLQMREAFQTDRINGYHGVIEATRQRLQEPLHQIGGFRVVRQVDAVDVVTAVPGVGQQATGGNPSEAR